MATARALKWGSYKGALACEYELIDNGGHIVGVDTVTVPLLPDERVEDAFPIIEAFLKRRAAKLALSDTPEKVARRREVRNGDTLVSKSDEPSLVDKNAPLPVVVVTAVEAQAMREYKAFDPEQPGMIIIKYRFEV